MQRTWWAGAGSRRCTGAASPAGSWWR
uniref:Uncharacterized protein n=1 Tax=Arundo donax TaxID=35708 RepID=A0A0A8YZM3_ARUDO